MYNMIKVPMVWSMLYSFSDRSRITCCIRPHMTSIYVCWDYDGFRPEQATVEGDEWKIWGIRVCIRRCFAVSEAPLTQWMKILPSISTLSSHVFFHIQSIPTIWHSVLHRSVVAAYGNKQAWPPNELSNAVVPEGAARLPINLSFSPCELQPAMIVFQEWTIGYRRSGDMRRKHMIDCCCLCWFKFRSDCYHRHFGRWKCG